MSRLWDEPIEIFFPELFSSLETEGFDELYDDTDGIRLNATNIAYEETRLSFELQVVFAFQRRFISSFRDIRKAINIIVENADTGQSDHLNLLDPHKHYPVQSGRNFDTKLTKPLPGKKISCCQIPLQIELDNPGWGPHLYIRAVLQDYNSNILAFDISKNVELGSFMNGEPYSIEISSEAESE